MMDELERYDRQRRLPEVGTAGQARLSAAELRVEGDDGAEVEREYLARAGVERLELAPRETPLPFAHEGSFRFAAARRVGAGAWRALCKMRGVLADK